MAQDSEKRRAYQRAWAKAHPEQVKASARASAKRRRDAHLEEARARRRAYYYAHPEKDKASTRAWVEANREAHREKSRAYRETHKEEYRALKKAHRETHREEYRATESRRRARKAASPVCDLTVAQWLEIKAAYGYRCVYCGRKMQRLTMDHLTPLSQGGEHTASNIVPACKSCNSRKGTRKVLVPIQPLLLTLAPAEDTRRNRP